MELISFGRLVQQYDVSFVSTGDVLRKEIMAKSEVGKKAEAVVANGGELSFCPHSLCLGSPVFLLCLLIPRGHRPGVRRAHAGNCQGRTRPATGEGASCPISSLESIG